jgi:hypothetical protein
LVGGPEVEFEGGGSFIEEEGEAVADGEAVVAALAGVAFGGAALAEGLFLFEEGGGEGAEVLGNCGLRIADCGLRKGRALTPALAHTR